MTKQLLHSFKEMELESENNLHFAIYKNRKKKSQKSQNFFHHLCDAITNVFFLCVSMRFLDAIFLKKNVRFDAIAIPDCYSSTAADQGPRLIDKPEKLTNQ